MIASVRAVRAICLPLVLLLAAAGMAYLGEQRARLAASASAPPVRYNITDLGTAGDHFRSVLATAINNRGQVTGYVRAPGGEIRAFLWKDGAFKDLGAPSGEDSFGRDLNDRGDVVGYARSPGVGPRYEHVVIFRYGKIVDTGIDGYGFGIDDKSQVVGQAYPQRRAFLYDGRRTIDLGTFGGLHSVAIQINNRGQIVGSADLASGDGHAFLYSNGKMKDLGTLDGTISVAEAINNKGWVVGLSNSAGGGYRPFLYRNGEMEPMENLGDFSCPEAINSTATVVGGSYQELCEYHAIVWIGGHVYNLDDLLPPGSGWELSDAHGINDRGQIVANGSLEGRPGLWSCILTPEKSSRTAPAADWWRQLFSRATKDEG
ncbi:MAG TPA: hypothetical protein VFJ58_06120 [Armatimonadota bacterium]|nr:hypothetical protein [Armatimonadota bacterium]